MLRFLIEKEFKLIRRNEFLPRLIIMMPIWMMAIMPFAANLEVRNINLAVVDSDHSPSSEQLIAKISASSYFNLVAYDNTYPDAEQGIGNGSTDIILDIPDNFERDIVNGHPIPQVLIAANAVNAIKASMGSSYLATIVQEFVQSKSLVMPAENQITITSQNRFNPGLNYHFFMVPALMVMLLTTMCGFLPAMNIVGEKEKGTIEQMNVTPVGKFSFILSKIIPYWIIGFVVLTICFIVAMLVYRLTAVGHYTTIYFAAMVFILVVSGIGLIISNYSSTLQQAMFITFFFLLIMLLLSGLFTPVESMPGWAQDIAIFNPLTYFIQIMRGVYLKGSGLYDIWPQLAYLAGFATIFNTWAVLSYHKNA